MVVQDGVFIKKKDWRSEKLYKTINYYTNYSCASISDTGCSKIRRKKYYVANPRIKVSEEHTKKRVNEYHKNNKHKWISQSKEIHRERLKLYYNTNPKYKERIQTHERKDRQLLNDAYVKKVIIAHNTGLICSDIPQELIELKRKQLLLTRIIRNNGN